MRRTRSAFRGLTGLALGAMLLAGCVSEDLAGQGSLTLEVAGGAAVRDGFPYTEGDVLYAFVDGWELSFTKYVITVGNVVLSDPDDGTIEGEWVGPKALDLAASATAAEDLVTLTDLPARRLDLAFDFVVPTAASASDSADPDDIAEMSENGWAFLIAGEARRDGEVVAFRYGLAAGMHNYECINGKDKTRGIAIEANKTIGAYLYAHAIHIFWDTLGTGNEDLRFDAMAAVAGDDGLVTEEELALQDLTDLQDADGEPMLDENGYALYDDAGLLPYNQHSLLDFVVYAARSSAHFNGVGLCRASALD